MHRAPGQGEFRAKNISGAVHLVTQFQIAFDVMNCGVELVFLKFVVESAVYPVLLIWGQAIGP